MERLSRYQFGEGADRNVTEEKNRVQVSVTLLEKGSVRCGLLEKMANKEARRIDRGGGSLSVYA